MKANQKHIITPTVEELEALYGLPTNLQPPSPEPIPQAGSGQVPDLDTGNMDVELCLIGVDILCEQAGAGNEEAYDYLMELTKRLDDGLERLKAEERAKRNQQLS